MKILYIGNERRHAQMVAKALRGIAQNAPIAWTHSLDQCAKYFAQNRDLAALVVDAQVHAGKWPASLRDLRSLPLRPAIVIVVPEGPAPSFDASAPQPDESVINGLTFLTDLPAAVTRAVARVRGPQPVSTPANVVAPTEQQPARITPEQAVDALLDPKPTAHAELEQKLAHVTAALQQAERRHAAVLSATRAAHEVAATEQLTEQERQFQAQIALEREQRRTAEERLSAATSARDEAERRYASAVKDAAAKSRELERIGQREAELLAQSERERAMHTALEQKIAKADAHAREIQQQHDAALTKIAEELEEQRAQLDRELSRASMEGGQLRQQLLKSEIALDEARKELESAAADVARLTRREADLAAQLATVQGELRTVEGRLSHAAREVEQIRESAARERVEANTRLEVTLAREHDARETLERKLSEIQSTAVEIERELRDEAAALRAQALEREASFDARLASERLEYDSRLTDKQSECERLGQACAAANEDVQRLSADLGDARRILENTRREFQETLDRQSTEHAMAVAALAISIAERDERLKEEAARHDAALQASERARAELLECLQTALAAGRHDIDQVQEALMATLEAVKAAKRRQDALQTQADHIAEPADARPESRPTTLRVVRQPEIAAWQQLSKDAALV